LFASLSRRDLQRISAHATLHRAQAGEELTREGRPGYEFFVIGEGRAVVRRKRRKVAGLKKGDVLLSCDGENLTDVRTLHRKIERLEEPRTVQIRLLRAGVQAEIEVRIELEPGRK
jgi:hypothetical protein